MQTNTTESQKVDASKVQQDENNSQQVVDKKLSIEELEAKVTKLEGLTEKFKTEAEGYRKKNSVYRADKEETEKKNLEEQGMYKEMYEKSEARNMQFVDAAKKGSRTSALKDALMKEGCSQKYLPLMVDRVSLDKLELDDQFKVNEEQVAFQVSQIKNEFIDLFKKEMTIKDGTPTETKNLSYQEELKGCSTQAQLDVVMKKHGRL